jgi:plasmid stability protein
MAKQSEEDDDDKTEGKGISQDEIRRMVVGTVKEQVGKALKGLDLKGMIGEALAPVLEQVESLKATSGGDKVQGQTSGQAPGALPPEVQKQIDQLAKANKALQDKYDAAEKLRAETEAKSRRKEERDALGAALRKAGVPEPLAAGAVAYLGERGTIKRTDDGAIRWAQGDDELELDKGAAAWLKTDEGRAYLPPRQVSGSGQGRNQQSVGTNGQRMSKDQEIEVALAAIAGMPDFGGQ